MDYPYANQVEYDHNIFNPHARGLRDRSKSMEDICYFLVGRLEGSAKNILSAYPCSQPSDTVAFRTSLSKYLEGLRHQSIYPSSKASGGMEKMGKSAAKPADKNAAWWWKDVVVRKSLLEECGGEKFERLILSISTHALLKGAHSSLNPQSALAILRSQPSTYSDLLLSYQAARQLRSRSASMLIRRQDELNALKNHLSSSNGVITSKYASLTTERLVAFADSKLQELRSHSWRSEQGQKALAFFCDLAGLKSSQSTSSTSSLTKNMENRANNHDAESKPQTPPQPLPIAAALHPTHLRRLRRSVFHSSKTKLAAGEASSSAETQSPKLPPGAHAKIALSDKLDAERRMYQAFRDALLKVRKSSEQMWARLEAMQHEQTKQTSKNRLDLWSPDECQPINFETQPTLELLRFLSLDHPEVEGALEARIDNIRESLLPAYPAIPGPSSPKSWPEPVPVKNSQAQMSSSTNIPKPTTRTKYLNTQAEPAISERPQTPESSLPPLMTSTPPQTVKHRSAYVKGILSTQKKAARREPRQSIRFSLAVNRRQSIFVDPIDGEDDVGQSGDTEDEISRIVYSTQDESTEAQSVLAMATPKKTPRPAVNRIYTAGTPRPKSSVKKPKHSYPMALMEPSMPLPSLMRTSLNSFSEFMNDMDDSEDEWGGATQDGKHSAAGVVDKGGGDKEWEWDETPSMTLRDILLKADSTQFDLLDGDPDDQLGDESFDWE